MADAGRNNGLGVIFSIFLGLMVTAFVGVGVYTFYSPPRQYDERQQELSREESSIRAGKSASEYTEAERQRIKEIDEEQAQLFDAERIAQKNWGRVTSIILVLFATLAMVVSLVRADQLPVISNGLLLGGVFTMLYGVGWIVATDTSLARFIVITFALAITLTLGYIRFVRRRTHPDAALPVTVQYTGATTDVAGLTELAQRLAAVEQKLNEAANALSIKG